MLTLKERELLELVWKYADALRFSNNLIADAPRNSFSNNDLRVVISYQSAVNEQFAKVNAILKEQ